MPDMSVEKMIRVASTACSEAVWGYARRYADSLDADRHTKHVRQIVAAAIKDINEYARSVSSELREAKKFISQQKREIKKLKEEIAKADSTDVLLLIEKESEG